jgi:serine/threonine protein kinase
MATGAKQLFSKGKGNEKLEDFKIRKMIGRGTFGKVYLVEQEDSGKMFAMKCIRKDIIIENEQMDNIQLEKEILFSIDHPFLVNMEFVF